MVGPGELGLEAGTLEALAGGEPEENARIITGVLDGSVRDAARTAVVVNAGAAIYAGGVVEDLAESVRRAEESVDLGAATAKLEALREASRRGR